MKLPPEKCQLKMTDLALRRTEAYACLVNEMYGPQECIGFLAGNADSDVIDTVILAPQQRVSASRAEIDGQGVLAAGRELERLGKQPKGWWHSHGRFATFHSTTDDSNTRDVLLQISHAHWTYMAEKLMLTQSPTVGVVRFVNDTNEIVEIRVDPALAEQLSQTSLRAWRKVPVSLAYSLVVNAQGDPPHAELYTRAWCSQTQSTQINRQVVPVTIVDTFDEVPLRQEIAAKVRPMQVTRRPATDTLPIAGNSVGRGQSTGWHMVTAVFPFITALLGEAWQHIWQR